MISLASKPEQGYGLVGREGQQAYPLSKPPACELLVFGCVSPTEGMVPVQQSPKTMQQDEKPPTQA
eukprot:6048838-Pyramimonas_sp.AAC.2